MGWFWFGIGVEFLINFWWEARLCARWRGWLMGRVFVFGRGFLRFVYLIMGLRVNQALVLGYRINCC